MKTREEVVVTRYYICEKCGTEYVDKEAKARRCESLPVFEPAFKVGDTVIIKKLDGAVRVEHVAGPYPPHPLGTCGAQIKCTPIFGGHFVPGDYYYRAKFFIKDSKKPDAHIYIYAVRGFGRNENLRWFFEGELKSLIEEK